MRIHAQIGDFEGGVSSSDFLLALKEHEGNDSLTIELNSPGGSVTDGIAIYSALMRFDGEVTIVVDTLAASIASVILCAADKVIVRSNAKVMIHCCWCVSAGNATEFRSTAEVMELLDKDIAAAYSQRTGMSSETAHEYMLAETWFTAEEAVALGFADEIEELTRKPRKAEAKAENTQIFAISAVAVAAKASAVARRMKLRIK